ncbi:MAG: LysM peptidoglycan-binding domain-containing protein [Actinobacteria bacterium]|nr:LysM peptidoglycan-binding domain-containing protein [Actinomycetota bacterium]
MEPPTSSNGASATTSAPRLSPVAAQPQEDATGTSGLVRKGETAFYVVSEGETLWAIARKLLGPDPSAAQVARLVDRLWALNADRIGTGSPDLILAGQRLAIP